MPTDLPPIFKKYLALLGKNEEVVLESAKNVKTWIVDNGEVVKERLERQIDSTATKMGFAKVSDLEGLHKRISELEENLVRGIKDSHEKEVTKKIEKKRASSRPLKKATAKLVNSKKSSSAVKKTSAKKASDKIKSSATVRGTKK